MPVSADQAALHRVATKKWLEPDKTLPARQRWLKLWDYILRYETSKGTSFLITVDNTLYVVLGETHEIMSLSEMRNARVLSYLNAMYGIVARETVTTFIYESMRAHTMQHGTRVELRRFAVYNEATQTAYLSTYQGHSWRLDGSDHPYMVPNGEDGVFFADDDGGAYTNTNLGHHGMLIERLTSLNFAPSGLGGITPEQQQQALTIWMFMLAFPDMMPTKPLLLIEGQQGSGKTASLQLIQLALMGMTKPMILGRNKEDEFGVMLLRSPIAILDNTDNYIEWVADSVCAYTTLGIFVKRKLYTDDEEAIIRPHAFLAVASKNPASFRREDVADRCIILRLDRRADFASFRKLREDILRDRNHLFGEYVWYVNQIVKEIRNNAADRAESNSRMADFSYLGRVVAKVLGWPEGSIEALMDALQDERDAFASEEDPLVELLHDWIAYRTRTGERAGQSNIGREINVQQLFTELETLAQARGITSWYKSPRTLAQKIRSPHIDREFNVKIVPRGGHRLYKIWRKTDPMLEVVDDEYVAGGITVEE